MAEITITLPSKGIVQNNFVRVLHVALDELSVEQGISFEQKICNYILGLNPLERIIKETDSKWNIVAGNFIYEIINKGKGQITELNPEDLLAIETDDLQKKIATLKLIGDVTGELEYVNEEYVIQTVVVNAPDEPNLIPVGTSFITDSFDYIGAQSFMLSENVINILNVTVSGQMLNQSQYQITNLRQITILDELDIDDNIIVLYNLMALSLGTTAADLGLDNVDNTSDLDKPVSIATRALINQQIAALSWEHLQELPAYNWNVTHGLGKYPSVTVIDSEGRECEGEVQYTSKDHVLLLFSMPLSGKAFFN